MEWLGEALGTAAACWYRVKLFLEDSLSVSNDAQHVVIGVLVQLVAGLLLRRPISALAPWLAALAAAVWNEAVDLWSERWPEAAMQYGESAKDVALTMLLPTVLLLAARLRPDLFRGGARKRKRR